MTTEDQCPSKDTPSEVKEDIEDRNETEGVDRKRRMSGSNLLWGEDERMVRKTVAKGFSGNIFSSFFVNGYSAVLIFTFYLISLESLLSIALSVSMTICKILLMFDS